MKALRHWIRLVGVALCGPILAAPFFLPEVSPVALCALVPWMLYVRSSTAWHGALASLFLATLFGSLWAGWIPNAVDVLGGSSFHGALGLLASAIWVQGPIFVLTGTTLWACRDRNPFVQSIAPALIFGLMTWWMERSAATVPAGLLGHGQLATLGVAQAAQLGGVSLLSAWIVAINASITLWIEKLPHAGRLAFALIASWLALAFFGLEAARFGEPTSDAVASSSLLLIQPDLRHGERWNPGMQLHNLQKLMRQTRAAVGAEASNIDLVIWPENTLTTPLDEEPDLRRETLAFVDELGVPLLLGAARSALSGRDGRYRSSVLWIEPQRGIVDAIDKQRAIPFVESSRELLPPGWVESIFGPAARWPKVEESVDAGPMRGGFEIAPVLCFEVLFPDLFQRRRTESTAFMVNLADESWVSGNALGQRLSDVAAFRAIEQRLPLVRVAHAGLTLGFDAYGAPLFELPRNEAGSTIVELHARTPDRNAALVAIGACGLVPGLLAYGFAAVVSVAFPVGALKVSRASRARESYGRCAHRHRMGS